MLVAAAGQDSTGIPIGLKPVEKIVIETSRFGKIRLPIWSLGMRLGKPIILQPSRFEAISIAGASAAAGR